MTLYLVMLLNCSIWSIFFMIKQKPVIYICSVTINEKECKYRVFNWWKLCRNEDFECLIIIYLKNSKANIKHFKCYLVSFLKKKKYKYLHDFLFLYFLFFFFLNHLIFFIIFSFFLKHFFIFLSFFLSIDVHFFLSF